MVDLAWEWDIEIEGPSLHCSSGGTWTLNHTYPGAAACEKSLACSTCHIILDPDIYDKLEEPTDEENDMLDLAFGLTDTCDGSPSRGICLSRCCWLTVTMIQEPAGLPGEIEQKYGRHAYPPAERDAEYGKRFYGGHFGRDMLIVLIVFSVGVAGCGRCVAWPRTPG
jgi:hypothetical protein